MLDAMPASHDDLYAMLGVARDANADDIKRAFRQKARALHPDAGGDPEAFKRVADAYEVLKDPRERARYDRRSQPRTGGPFYGSHWNGAGTRPGATGAGAPANDGLDLEDIFNDFGDVRPGRATGGGRPTVTPQRPAPSAPPRTERAAPAWGDIPQRDGARPRAPSTAEGSSPQADTPNGERPGGDVHTRADVPADIARDGGSVTVTYRRLRRSDDGRSVQRHDEIHELRIPPGTADGATLDVPRMGHASLGIGGTGALLVEIRVVAAREPGRMKMPPRPPSATPRQATPSGAGASPAASHLGTATDTVTVVDIGVRTAILGGEIRVPVASGEVRVVVPPGSSSGTRLRLRGRGRAGGDVVAELRILVPSQVDDEARRLLEAFAARTPGAS